MSPKLSIRLKALSQTKPTPYVPVYQSWLNSLKLGNLAEEEEVEEEAGDSERQQQKKRKMGNRPHLQFVQ
jgi:hypothetical protein